jgi:hypothetical protein
MGHAACEDEQTESEKDPEIRQPYRCLAHIDGQPKEATEERTIRDRKKTVSRGVAPHYVGPCKVTGRWGRWFAKNGDGKGANRKGWKAKDTSCAYADQFSQYAPPACKRHLVSLAAKRLGANISLRRD